MIELNADQKNASGAFTKFLMKDDERFFVLSGGAGAGKSTLIKHLLDTLEDKYKMIALLKQKQARQLDVAVTATTNKAAAVLREMDNAEPKTIHSFLKLKVTPNFATGETDLVKAKGCSPVTDHLIIIDEASFIDDKLFSFIQELTPKCKIVLVGDQYQLAPVGQTQTLMETVDCAKAELNQIMRNSGIIMETGLQFKETVKNDNKFNPIIPGPKGSPLIRVKGPEFKALMDEAFLANTYDNTTAKVLAWTNSRVIAYNNHIRKIKGFGEDLQVGETVMTNKPIAMKSTFLPIDSEVYLTDMEEPTKLKDIEGRFAWINGSHRAFLPDNHLKVKALQKKYAKKKDWMSYFEVKDHWLDLRPSYASTVHKAQGSTYETVFIDMADIGKCFEPSDVARMVYVAITRASKQVVIYGDLPYRYR